MTAATARFLGLYPPFDGLSTEARQTLVECARQVRFAAGSSVLVEDGPPAGGVWLILSGSVELVHQGECIKLLEAGECFGHPSLLTGMAPAFTVSVRSDCECLWFAREDVLPLFATPAGVAFVAATLRSRLVAQGHTVDALHDVGTTPVSAIMRPPRWLEAHATLADAARALADHGSGAVLVELGGAGVGILGDAELTAAIGGGELSLAAPLARAAITPAPGVPVGQLAVEAAIDMLAAGTECVAVYDGERIVGVLSARDLVGLDTQSPIALRRMIMGAADMAGLLRSVSHLPKLFLTLVNAGVGARDIGRVLSLQHDAIVNRLLEFAISRFGPAPVPWAWLDLGSAARREFTLASDQDNAFAYADPEPRERDKVDAYFANLGKAVNEGLARCGIGVDNNGVMAGERLWRMSKSEWANTFTDCYEDPNESRLIRATVAFDFRHVGGGLTLSGDLAARIRTARTHAEFMHLLARTASGYPVALTLRGTLALEKHGETAGKLDLKLGAVVPLVNLVRYHALAAAVTISPTLDRIEAAVAAGGLDRGTGDALSEAFDVITRTRMNLHARRLAAGQSPDNLLDPEQLPPIARGELRDALQAVRRAQRRIAG